MGTRAVVARLVLLAGGLLVPLALVEGGLRLAGVGGPAELDSLWDRRVYHYRHHPSRANPWARGERQPLRVAVVGDSFTVGATNDPDDTYPFRLERLLNLNQGVRPARVGVFAQRGWSTHQQLNLLDRALGWKPDLVVVGIFLNDPEAPNDPRIDAMELLPRTPEGAWATALRASRALAWIYQGLENVRSQRAREGYMEYIYDPEYEGWKLFERALVEFAERCRARGVPLAAVVFPTMAELDRGYPSRVYHERIVGALERAGIAHRDLLDAFLGTSPLRMAAYPGIDPHPSEIAHRVMAHGLFEFLLDEGLIDPAYRPQSVYVDKSMQRWMTTLRQMRSVAYPYDPQEAAGADLPDGPPEGGDGE